MSENQTAFTKVSMTDNRADMINAEVAESVPEGYTDDQEVHVYIVFADGVSIDEGISAVESGALNGGSLNVLRRDDSGHAVAAVMTYAQEQKAESLRQVDSVKIETEKQTQSSTAENTESAASSKEKSAASSKEKSTSASQKESTAAATEKSAAASASKSAEAAQENTAGSSSEGSLADSRTESDSAVQSTTEYAEKVQAGANTGLYFAGAAVVVLVLVVAAVKFIKFRT